MGDRDKGSGSLFAHAGVGKYLVTAEIFLVGKDIVASVTGGDRLHVGAVAVAQCTPGVIHPDRQSVSVSVLTLPGHKEDEIARETARRLSEAFSVNAVVTAGMHWDGISAEGIETAVRNTQTLADAIIGKLKVFKGERRCRKGK